MDQNQASNRVGDGREPECLSRSAFATELAASYSRLWLLAAAITRDRGEAEDVVQEASLIALRKIGQFEVGTNFHAWMSKIVRLQAYNVVRKRAGRQTVAVDPTAIDRTHQPAQDSDGGQDGMLDHRGELAADQPHFDDAVVGALGEISETARACLLLRICEQLSYAQIAEMLEIPAGTAMSHVHRAKAMMRDKLKRTGLREDERGK